MPPIFKAIASISVWVFWIISWISGICTTIMGIVNGDLFGTSGGPPSMIYPAIWAVSGLNAIIAGVFMLIRKKLE
jgi:uncharacterized membrane protein YuzA (DUF378 family)